MTDTPDTGAGTPLRQAIRDELERLLADAHGVPGDERDRWAARLARAARSRPATDPAGLDVAIREVLHEYGVGCSFDAEFQRTCESWTPNPHAEFTRLIAGKVRARLSVADGPGPEERLLEPEERR